MVIAAVLVASFSVISYVQTALAQGNMSAASAKPGSPQTAMNQTSMMMNQTSAMNATNATK